MATERVFGIVMMKDEADVAQAVIRHMDEEGLDEIIAVDNGSTDGTLDLLFDVKPSVNCRLHVWQDDEVAYYQSRKMTWLAQQAADRGATWVVPFDADEIWYSHDDRLGNFLRRQSREVVAYGARLSNHFTTDFDGSGNPFESMVYRHPDPAPLAKVAVRPHEGVTIEAGNHSASWGDSPMPIALPDPPEIEIRHFPYRSFEQMRSKAVNGGRAYEGTDLPHDVGAHWREYYAIWQRGGDEALREVYDRWFHFTAPVAAGMVLDPAPYCRWSKST